MKTFSLFATILWIKAIELLMYVNKISKFLHGTYKRYF